MDGSLSRENSDEACGAALRLLQAKSGPSGNRSLPGRNWIGFRIGRHIRLLAGVHIQPARGAGKNQHVEMTQILGVSGQVFLGQQL